MRSLPCMGSLMFSKIVFMCVDFIAEVTGMGFFPIVAFQVPCKGALVSKCLIADIAPIGFFSCVNPPVSHEVTVSRECFITIVAAVGLFSGV